MRIAPILLLVLLGCPGAETGETDNKPPEAIITYPEGGTRQLDGYPVQFRGLVTDPDDADGLTVTWTTDSRELCAETPVGPDGIVQCEAVVFEADTVVVLTGTDPKGVRGSASISIEVRPSDDPVATILSPDGSGPYYAGVEFPVSASITDAEDLPSALTATWFDNDVAVVLDTTVDGDGLLNDTLSLTAGEHDLRLHVVDVTGKSGDATVHLSVKEGDTAPVCAITSPENNGSGGSGVAVTFAGLVTDVDISSDHLTAEFSSDLDGVIGAGPVNADGTVSFDVSTLRVGTHRVTLTGMDELGGTCSESVLYSVGSPPTIVIDDPVDGDVYSENETVAFVGEVSDEFDAPEALGIAWESDVDGVLDLTPADATGLIGFDIDGLSFGDHLVTARATDTDGLYAEAYVAITINDLPDAPGITLSPTSPYGDDELVVSVNTASSDWEGDAISYTYAWTVDGVPAAYSGTTVPASATTRDQVWTVVVTPNDGWGDGDWATASVTIGNSAPTVASATISPDPASEGDTLTCVAGAAADLDGDAVTLAYSWTVNGAAVAETTDTLADVYWGHGDTVSCTVTPNDGTVSGAAVTSASVTITNSTPAITGVTISPSPAIASDTLTCADVGFTDADGDADQTTFAWTVNGTAVGTGATLAGAFVGNDVVECTATPFDGSASGTPMVASLTITGSAPVIADVAITPSVATESDTLTCIPGVTTDADGTTAFTYTYAWTVNGVAIGATTDTLTGTSFNKDDAVRCGATAFDGTLSSVQVFSDPVGILNSAPVISAVTVSPTDPATDETLTATVTATDVDGDSISLGYAWYVNGVVVTTSGNTLPGSTFVHGDSVYVLVTPTDGSDVGTPVASSPVTVANTAPSITSASITPEPGYVDSTLSCAVAGYADLDGDADQSTFAWTVNGAAAGTGATLTGAFVYGDVVVCTATPYDGADAGTARTDSITITNSLPVLASLSITPAIPVEGDTLTCVPGTTTDADGTTSFTYGYTWSKNGSTVAVTTATLSSGYFAHGDTITCTATPNDGIDDGAAVTSTSVTVENTAPVVSNVTLAPSSVYTNDTITATVTASDADGDTLTYSYAWFVDGVAVSATGSTLSGVSSFSRDQVVYVVVTATDGTDASAGYTSSSLTVLNTAPVISAVSLTPATPTEASTLTCAPTSSDADSDSVSYTYAWYVNGSAVGATSSTLTGTYFDHNDTVYCRVTPTDGTTAGTAVSSSSVTVSNTAPVLSAVSLTPTTAYETSTLTCTPTATDADGDTVSYTYAWYVNSSVVAATSSTLTGTYFSKGQTVYCRVTPTDGTTAGTAMSSSTVTISNTAPTMTSATLTPTTAYEASTLTCTAAGTDSDGDTLSYTYAWYVNGSAVAATSSTLTGTYFSKNNTVYCTATASDGSASSSAATSSTVTISNTAPVISAVSLTPTTATEASTLTCAPTSSDADGDSVSYTYAWYVNGSAVAATSSTLTGTYFGRSDTVYCSVTPTDGSTAGSAVSSSSVTVSNTAPVLSAVSLTPTTASETSTLTCAPTATDADGDTISYTYAWYVNSSVVAATSSTLTGTYFSRGNTVYCRVTPTDGTTSGTAMSSSTVTIGNTAPTAATATLTPTTAYEASTLTCAGSGSTDSDPGDSVSYTYAWYVNGSVIAPTTATLTGTYFSKTNTVYCTATPTDGTSSGTAGTSSTVTISNTAPTAATATLTPTTASESSTLTCAGSASTDADGDSVSYTYAWYVNSAVIAPTTSTLTGTYFSRGNTVYCTATPSDGSTTGTAGTSSTVTIGNTAPTGAVATLTPTTAYETSTLTCTASGATDADPGDTVSYSYAWYVNSSLIAPTTTTLTGTYFSRADSVYCKVTPTDGTTAGTAAASSAVTISNTAPSLSSVTLTPTTAYESSTFTCTPSATDGDSDTLTYTYAWYVNGSAIAPTTSTLTGTYFSRGNTVYCTAVASDGSASSSTGTSATVTVSNTAPVTSAVSLTPATAYETSTLTCAATSTDADSDALTYTYAWYVNGSAIAPTTATLTGTYFSRGNTVYCSVTASDGTASASAVSSSTVTIGNSAPEVSSVALTPTTAYEASTLTCTPTGSDSDPTDTVSYTYAWYVNSSLIAPTTSTLTGTYFSKSDSVYCKVTPSDGTTSGTAVSSSAVTISNTAPTMTSATLTPTTAYETSTFTCTAAGTDGDSADSLSYTYAWYVNGSVIAPTTSTLTGTYFSKGNTVYCTAKVSDGTTTSAVATSATVTIANSAPTMTSVSMSPTTAYESSTITCTAAGADADSADTLSYTYAWYVNGSLVAPTSTTLTGTYFNRGGTVYCSVTVSDGTTSSSSMAASSITIANTAPVASSVSLTPTTAYEASTLTCSPSATDADGDVISYSYAWYVNSSLIAPTTSTLTGTYFSRGNTVYCRVTPNDGSTSGSAMSSATVTISNTAPVTSAVTLSPTLVYEASTITCSPTSTDADGDSVSYTYAWYVNSVAVAATGSTLSGTYFSKSNTVYCRVTPTDGTTAGSAMSSSTVTVSNTAPTAPVASVSPSSAEEGVDPIVCSLSTASTDADGDSITYSFTWTKNGSSYTGDTDTATTSTVPASATTSGDTFICSVTATDGSATSSASTATSNVLGMLYYAGYYTAFSSNSSVATGYLFAEQVTISAAASLYTMGYGGRSGNTASVMMALYTDSAGTPGTLVGYTTAITPVGMEEVDVTTAPVALTAGTYWMAWEVSGSTLKGTYSASCSGVVTYYKSYTYGSFPSTWPSGASSLTGQCNNIFVGLR